MSNLRRFQKIFEEGPPTIAKKDVFHEMERAAMRLTALVSYRGAGTVEYLYSPETDTFCFLELNPRLQVEHPVTEAITGVNMPATQLQIAMGIPLYNMPDIRTLGQRFGFFRDCWGYFSCGLKGAIHEFADSQFGHIFAKGPNREAARKSLRFALMNLETWDEFSRTFPLHFTDIQGDIRHPVDYLVDLIETKEYRENTIDTMWLDGLIASKAITPSLGVNEVVFYAAVFRAFDMAKTRTQEAIESMQKGQLVLLGKNDTDALTSFHLDITYDDRKFSFQVTRKRSDIYCFTINGGTIAAKVREQPDGSLYVTVGRLSQHLKGKEEALGLRLIIGAQTIMVPNVYDPSELRSDVNGKELEAMKMIMSLKSPEAGKVSHALSAGSIVSAGELLAKLELKDPSKVKKISPFEGVFSLGEDLEAVAAEPLQELLALLDGFCIEAKGPEVVLFMIAAHNKMASRNETVMAILREMVAAEGSGMSCMYVPDMREEEMDGGVHQKVVEISQLPSTAAVAGDYGNVRYLAQQLLDVLPQETYAQRFSGLQSQLRALEDKAWASGSEMPGAVEGNLEVELLVDALYDSDAKVQKGAIQSYLHWLAAPSRLSDVVIQDKSALWTQFFPVSVEGETHKRHGLMLLLPEVQHLESTLEELLPQLVTLQGSSGSSVPLNFLHVVLGKDAFPSVTDRTLFYNTDDEMKKAIKQSQDIFAKKAEILKAAGVGEISLVLPQPPRHPRFAKFLLDEQEEWSEQEMGRDMWPSFAGMLELGALKRICTLQRIHKEVRPTSHIYLATQPVVGGKSAAPELLMRALYLSKINKDSFGQCLADSLDVALDEVEHAMLDPRVAKFGQGVTSRIFLHFLSELDMSRQEIEKLLTESISSHAGHRSSEMIKLCIDQIEVKVHQRNSSGFEILRMSLSSLHGGFLKPKLLREILTMCS
eukprot:s859_g1.t1